MGFVDIEWLYSFVLFELDQSIPNPKCQYHQQYTSLWISLEQYTYKFYFGRQKPLRNPTPLMFGIRNSSTIYYKCHTHRHSHRVAGQEGVKEN